MTKVLSQNLFMILSRSFFFQTCTEVAAIIQKLSTTESCAVQWVAPPQWLYAEVTEFLLRWDHSIVNEDLILYIYIECRQSVCTAWFLFGHWLSFWCPSKRLLPGLASSSRQHGKLWRTDERGFTAGSCLLQPPGRDCCPEAHTS